jgi:hypothetical protein
MIRGYLPYFDTLTDCPNSAKVQNTPAHVYVLTKAMSGEVGSFQATTPRTPHPRDFQPATPRMIHGHHDERTALELEASEPQKFYLNAHHRPQRLTCGQWVSFS